MKASGTIQEDKMAGRSLLTPRLRRPLFYRVRMKFSAPEHVVAKSPCWYFGSQLRKVRSSGEMVYCGQEIPAAGEELWHLAALWLPQRHPQHLPRVPGPDHSWNRHPCARGPMPRTTQSRSWRWRRSQPVSATDQQFRDCQIRFLLPHPASITCTSQASPPKGWHLLLGAGLLVPRSVQIKLTAKAKK